jgi:hypothetical protein
MLLSSGLLPGRGERQRANKDDFKFLVEGDDRLFNQYGVILVDTGEAPECEGQGSPAPKDKPQSEAIRSTASSSFRTSVRRPDQRAPYAACNTNSQSGTFGFVTMAALAQAYLIV